MLNTTATYTTDYYISGDYRIVFEDDQIITFKGAAYNQDYYLEVYHVSSGGVETLLEAEIDYSLNISLEDMSRATIEDPTFVLNLYSGITMLTDAYEYPFKIKMNYLTLDPLSTVYGGAAADLLSAAQTYALDLTGENEENHVIEERHYINTQAGKQVIVPMAGAFYSHDVVLKNKNGITWTEGVQYEIVGCNQAATKVCYHESGVYNYIVVKQSAYVGEVEVSYRAFGGTVSVHDFNLLRATLGSVLLNLPDMNLESGTGNVGEIFIWPMETAPEGSFECNGQEVSREAYAELFEVIGTTYGEGDGSTTFNIPDLRGEFVRGFDNDRGKDPARTIGSHQSGSLIAGDIGSDSPEQVGYISYTGGANFIENRAALGQDPIVGAVIEDYPLKDLFTGEDNWHTGYYPETPEDPAYDLNANLVGITRPTNVAMLFCIRHTNIASGTTVLNTSGLDFTTFMCQGQAATGDNYLSATTKAAGSNQPMAGATLIDYIDTDNNIIQTVTGNELPWSILFPITRPTNVVKTEIVYALTTHDQSYSREVVDVHVMVDWNNETAMVRLIQKLLVTGSVSGDFFTNRGILCMWNNYAFGDGAVSYDWSTDHNINEPGYPPSVTRPVFEVDSAGIKKLPIWKTIDNDDTTAVSMTIKHYSLPSLSPEVEDFYLKGTVNDTGIDVDIPFINADTLVSSILTTNNGVWDSRTDLINDTDWSDVFPIDVAANISRTVIQCFGDYRQEAATDEEEFWIGTITIDWVNDRVTGSVRSRINSNIHDTNFYINETISELAGGVGTFTAHNDNGTTFTIAPQIHIVGRQIIALPVVDIADHAEMLANVDYHISHYKTIQTSSAESVSYDMTITKYNAGVHEYTPSENTTFFVVELVGGGGTSKRTVNGDGTSLRLANGGGGGYCKKKFNVADIESPATLTVGTSGNASTFEGMVAEAGEDSDVGVGYATGGDGGDASGGDVLLAGENGSAIHIASNASTIFGGLAPFNISGAAGGCSLGNAGRGGTMSGSPATWPAINTANGYNGVAIITEYIRTTA